MRCFVASLIALSALVGCSQREAADDELQPARAPEFPRLVPAQEALAGAHIPTLDPATMSDAEIEKVLPSGPTCRFRYTSAGRPVLAWDPQARGASAAAVKLNGYLVALNSAERGDAIVLAADTVRLSLTAEDALQFSYGEQSGEAELVFEVRDQLRVGYRGYYLCIGSPTDAQP